MWLICVRGNYKLGPPNATVVVVGLHYSIVTPMARYINWRGKGHHCITASWFESGYKKPVPLLTGTIGRQLVCSLVPSSAFCTACDCDFNPCLCADG